MLGWFDWSAWVGCVGLIGCCRRVVLHWSVWVGCVGLIGVLLGGLCCIGQFGWAMLV